VPKPQHAFRSRCSIARTLEIVGDKWTLLLVRDLMWHEKHTFQELQESEENMPANLLSQRLKRLMEWGVIRREPYQERPLRYRYFLTEKGKKLEPALLHLMSWGHTQLGGGLYDPVRKISKTGVATRKSRPASASRGRKENPARTLPMRGSKK